MSSLITKIVVFGDDGSGSSAGQIVGDDQKNIDGDGKLKTAFYLDDVYAFLLILNPGFRFIDMKSTDGTVSDIGPVTRPQVDRIFFSEREKQENLSRKPVGDLQAHWYGTAAIATVDEQTVSADKVPTIADISYSYAARSFSLQIPANLAIGEEDGADYPIGIVAYVERVADD